MSSLDYKGLFIVISFLVLWSIYLSSSHYHYFISGEFFSLALTDGHSLESRWQQAFSGLQDSSRYSGQSLQCCRLDGLDSSSKLLWTVLRAPVTIGITFTFIFHFTFIFISLARSKYLFLSLFFFFLFSLCGPL